MQKTMIRLGLALPVAAIIFTVTTPQAVRTAHAGVEYPWCAIYSEKSVGATNCGFSTYAQCAATIAGVGGICNENPAYVAPAYTQRTPRKPVKQSTR